MVDDAFYEMLRLWFFDDLVQVTSIMTTFLIVLIVLTRSIQHFNETR